MAKLTLPGGAVIDGTPSELAGLIGLGLDTAGLNEGELAKLGYYRSASRGKVVKIVDMDTMYLRNAIAKRIVKWAENLQATQRKEMTNGEFVKAVALYDRAIRELIWELERRGNSPF